MNDLRAITSSALLGTQRSPLGTLENPQLEAIRLQLEAHGTEKQLLGTSVVAFNMARAGLQANNKIPSVAPAAADTRAVISEAAQERLGQLFAQHTDLIPEWLELANHAGFRVPHQDLIALLDYGRQHTQHRPKVQPLLDSRGRWLAQQNPYWTWATGNTSSLDNALETWEIGAKAARVLALQTIRQANPEQARTLLETVWKSEPADERKSFLNELEHELSNADETFLETCLDDRSKDVRSIAADLLAKLPSSAFIKRMVARGQQILTANKKGIEVNLPEWTNELGRDSIEKKPPYPYRGEKAYWLESILQNIPPETWQTHLGLEPKEILKRLPKEWKPNIVQAIIKANQNNPSTTWIQALLQHEKNLIQNASLMNTLPLEQREQLVRQHIFGKTLLGAPALETYWMAWMEHTWSIEFSQEVLQWLSAIGNKFLTNTTKHIYINELGQRIHPKIQQHWHKNKEWTNLLRLLEQQNPDGNTPRAWNIRHYSDQIKTLILTLETRAAMRKELQP
jgi:hypothetical protein